MINLKNINVSSAKVQAMAADWDLVDALWGGTSAMRAARQKYLPKRPLEEPDDYDYRLNLSTLYPSFIETVTSLVGRAFFKPMSVGDGLKDWIKEEVVEDIDLQGRKFEIYLKDWFEEGVRYGLSHTLIEAPSEKAKTKAEQKEKKIRPYLVQVSPRQVLDWTQDRGVLTKVRIRFVEEREDPADEFATIKFDVVKIFTQTEIHKYERSGNDEFVEVDGSPFVNDFGFVPLVTLYTNRTGFMTAEPPLRELAYLNAKHWILQSGLDSLIDVVGVPILVMTGVTENDDIKIGARHAIRLDNADADIKFVEHGGKAIQSIRTELDQLKDDMREAGAKPLVNNSVAKTATQTREESARGNSQLAEMVTTLQDTAVFVLDQVSATRDGDDKGSGAEVKLQPNLDPDDDPNKTMDTLMKMRDRRLLADRTVFNAAKDREMIPDDHTWEEELEEINRTAID